MLIRKEHRWVLRNVKATPVEFQHALVVADVDREEIKKVVK